MSTRLEKHWTERGRGDGHGRVEKEDQQSYRRLYMMGKAGGKEDVTYFDIILRRVEILVYLGQSTIDVP